MIVFFFSVRLPPPKREDLVDVCAGRFERAVAESVGNKSLRFGRLQLFFRDDLLQLLLLLLLHITLPIAVNIRCGVDRTNKAVDQIFFAAQLDAALLNRICCLFLLDLWYR